MTTLKLAGALATLPEDCTELPTTVTPPSWSGNVSALLDAREKTHGDYSQTAETAQSFKALLRKMPNWSAFSAVEKDGYEQIVGKIARAGCGDHRHKDNPIDIAGYAKLIARSL